MEQTDATSNSQFALPPMEYVHLYSNEAVKLGIAPEAPPVITGVYHMFGQQCNTEEPILNPLSVQEIQQVYSSGTDPRVELKRLNRSLVAAFLDLVELLIRCPESTERQAKTDDMRLLLINIHHLLNEYRPQQARQCMQLTLSLQHAERTHALSHMNDLLEQVAVQLRQCSTELALPLDTDADLMKHVHALLESTKHIKQQVHLHMKDTPCEENANSVMHNDRQMCEIMDAQG